LKEVTPRIGNNAKGSKAVTATGKVSVAHHTAINTTTPATFHAVSFNPSGDGKRRNKKNKERKKDEEEEKKKVRNK
jgi:hypothetical protein